jgi:hypothetical protein
MYDAAAEKQGSGCMVMACVRPAHDSCRKQRLMRICTSIYMHEHTHTNTQTYFTYDKASVY